MSSSEVNNVRSRIQVLSAAIWIGMRQNTWLTISTDFRLRAYEDLFYLGKSYYERCGRMVTRIPFNMYLKMSVNANEAQVIQFVQQNTKVPVPTLLDVVHDTDRGLYYTLMTEVEGTTLYAWLRTSPPLSDISIVTRDLRDAVEQFHGVEVPSTATRVSNFYGGQFRSYRISNGDWEWLGPFSSIRAFHTYLVFTVHYYENTPELRTFVRKSHDKAHRLCFTHGDLNAHNIIVKDGRLAGIIDWECAGWMPEYWDHSAALWHGQRILGMKEIIAAVFPPHTDEMEVEAELWRANHD